MSTKNSIHDLKGLKKWLKQTLRPKDSNVFELEQIYKHFQDLGYIVEYTKDGIKYIQAC